MDSSSEYLLEARNIVKVFGELRANDDGGASRVIQDWVLEMWGCATIAARLIPMGVCVLLGTFPIWAWRPPGPLPHTGRRLVE